MPINPGVRLGPYEVTAAIGAGGMGEVYRAHDTRLGRDVAIKILPDSFARDSERLARFEREARTLAALNHPNIAIIHGFEEANGIQALVMEFVDGPTLADRIAREPIPLDEALPIARQIAEALEAAHERGIIHRDLKPANVKVRHDGTVKVLDFGLAKALTDGSTTSAQSLTNSPTITSPVEMTGAGVLLGTAAYMSPEQARGRLVDKRADVWAFGCVLFEMLAGRPVFAGETITETLASVMRDEPRVDQLPVATPPVVRTLLVRCLERDPKRRLRDIGEARIALDGAASGTAVHTPRDSAVFLAARRTARRAIPWVIAAASLVAAAVFATQRPSPVTNGSLELEIGPPPDGRFLINENSGNVALSPDGTRIVFRAATAASETLWIRSLALNDAKPLAGTEGAWYQFWAPDSRRLAFFAGGKLKTLDLAAGLPQSIADVANPRGGSWSEDDVILFATGAGAISRIPARGGTPEGVTRLDTTRGENAHYWPLFLPGGRKFLYFVRSFRLENSGIYAADIDGSDPVRLVSSLSSGIYAQPTGGRPGYLLWAQNGNLLAQAFDADRTELSGQPVTIVSGVRVLEAQRGLLATVSRTGAIAWATPRATETRFGWYARDGQRIETLALDAGLAMQTRISPDGRRLVFTQVADGMADIFVHDFAERRSRRISQSADYDEQPVWSPDSAEIVHRGNDQGMTTLMRVRIDGAAPAVELFREKGQMTPTTWSPDRRHILFMKFMPGQGMDTLLFPANDSKTITPLLTGPANDGWALFSPDGRWLAFNSNRSGRNEAYIARFRGDLTPPAISGHPLQISTDGGGVFGWRRDGKEVLLYSPAADDQVMAVPIDGRGETISVGTPTLLFRLPANHGCCAMTPDADRFLVAEYPYAAAQTIRVLTNWHERIE